jgi:tetratricopeptide (TPR) repeat protein
MLWSDQMKEKKLLLLLVPVLILAGWFIYRSAMIPGVNISKDNYSLAMELITKGKLDEAVQLLEQGKASNPTQGRYDFALGNIARLKNDPSQALVRYQEAIQKSPELPEPYNNAAGILMMQNKLDEALTIVETGLQHKADFKDLLFKKGQLLYLKDRFKEAAEALRPLTADTAYVEAYRFLGLAEMKAGERVKALEALQAYLEKTPGNTQGRSELEKIVNDLKK